MKFSKILSIALIFVLALSFTACGSSNPKTTVKNFLASYQKSDFEKMNALLEDESTNQLKNIISTENETTLKIVKAMTENIKYNIKNVEINDNTATVEVNITSPDIQKAMNDFISDFFTYSMDILMDTNKTVSKEEQDAYMKELLDAKLNIDSLEEISTDVKVTLNKVDGKWKIVGDINLFDAISGNYASFLSNTQDSFGSLLNDDALKSDK